MYDCFDQLLIDLIFFLKTTIYFSSGRNVWLRLMAMIAQMLEY